MIVSESLHRDILRLIVWYPVRWLLFLLPFRWGFSLIKLIGTADYYLSGHKRDIVARNLCMVFADRDDLWAQSVVKKYIQNHYVNQLQIMIFPAMSNRNMGQYHTFEGIENLDNALRVGKGCILAHAHFGPAQMPLHLLGVMGYPMMQVGHLIDDSLSFIGRNVAFRLRKIYEGKIRAQIVPASTYPRVLFRWLEQNGVLMMTGDGAGRGAYIGRQAAANLLGKTIPFAVGPFSLASRFASPVLPLFTIIEDDKRYRTIIGKPIVPSENNSIKNRESAYLQEFIRIMEQYVRDYPYLWHFWDEFNEREKAALQLAEGEMAPSSKKEIYV